MTYKVKKEKAEELKDGRTISAISKKTGYSTQHISEIFLGKRKCSKALAILLVNIIRPFVNTDENVEMLLNFYFDKVEK